MTPLGVSLAFIMISILISVAKHFVFPSSAPTTSDESSIEMKKLYTITYKRSEKESKSYSSFYEAYHQFHLQEAEEQKHRIEENFMKQYNSFVMKKSIINDDFTIICEENYLMTVSEGINCQKLNNLPISQSQQSQQCAWMTQFNVYELPLLKEQTKQSISIEGRIGLSKKDSKGQSLRQNLKCKKIPNSKKYFVSFPLSNKNSSLVQETWTLNKLTITKNNVEDYDEKRAEKMTKMQKLKNAKPKKLEVRAYNTPKTEIPTKKGSNKSFDLEMQYYSLQKPNQEPTIFNSNQESLSYATESEPWLVRYKTNKEWKQVNILQKGIQDRVYEDLQYQSRTPPFDRNDKIEMKDLFVYDSREDIYPIDCNDKEEENDCDERIKTKKNTYLTVVYLHMNNQYRVEKFYVQLTFEIGRSFETQKESKQKQKQRSVEQNYQSQTHSSLQLLVSYSLLISQINPARQIHSQCSINPKKQKIIERHFDKFYWLYENKLISSLQTYSLLCVFRFQVDEHLKVVEISDLIHSTEINRYNDFAFLDWKSLNKILNYKENFQQATRRKSIQNLLHQQSLYLNTRNKTQLNTDSSSDSLKNTQTTKTTKSPNPSDNIDQYLQIFNQQFVTPKKSQLKMGKQKPQKDQETQTKKKTKKKRNDGQKKDKHDKNDKQDKNSKNKRKTKNDSQWKGSVTLLKGQHKPNTDTSYNYSFIKKTVFPHRSEVRKYKFPLPFLLSFTQRMEIVDADPLKPMILFSGVRQYLFTYNYKSQAGQNTSLPNKVVDYRYLTLGSNYKPTSRFFHSSQGTPQHEIQTVNTIIKDIGSRSSQKSKQKLTIEIKDETHPEIENVIKTMYESDQEILNQVKSIKSIPVEIKRRWSQTSNEYELPQTYQRYLIVVWGWGVEVYLVDWDKNGFLRDNVTQEQIEEQLSKKSSNLVEYFLPFIELFATFYCMFQALISSR